MSVTYVQDSMIKLNVLEQDLNGNSIQLNGIKVTFISRIVTSLRKLFCFVVVKVSGFFFFLCLHIKT